MNDAIVEVDDKQVVGIQVRISNQDKVMMDKIMKTWQQLYKGVHQENKHIRLCIHMAIYGI